MLSTVHSIEEVHNEDLLHPRQRSVLRAYLNPTFHATSSTLTSSNTIARTHASNLGTIGLLPPFGPHTLCTSTSKQRLYSLFVLASQSPYHVSSARLSVLYQIGSLEELRESVVGFWIRPVLSYSSASSCR